MTDNGTWVDPDEFRHDDNNTDDAAAGAGDPQDGEQVDEDLATPDQDSRDHAKEFSEAALKAAKEAGYVAAGLAGLVTDKAKAFYDEQREQYAKTHPDADKDPGAKEFLQHLSSTLNRFVDDITRGIRDLADRGREQFEKDGDGEESASDRPSNIFTDSDLHEEPASSDSPPPMADDERNDL